MFVTTKWGTIAREVLHVVLDNLEELSPRSDNFELQSRHHYLSLTFWFTQGIYFFIVIGLFTWLVTNQFFATMLPTSYPFYLLWWNYKLHSRWLNFSSYMVIGVITWHHALVGIFTHVNFCNEKQLRYFPWVFMFISKYKMY